MLVAVALRRGGQFREGVDSTLAVVPGTSRPSKGQPL
jgi:hypothetical protein